MREAQPTPISPESKSGENFSNEEMDDPRRDGENGFLVPVKNSRALAEAFIKLISNKQLRQRMGNAGRKMAIKEFSIQIVIEQTFAVYQDLLKPLKTQSPPLEKQS